MEVKGTFEADNVETGEVVVKGIKDYEEKAEDSSAKDASTIGQTRTL